MEKVNVIVGRFQPLTLGHLKCAEEVWNRYGIRTVFCIVDTPESKLNEKHPFPSELIISQNEMIGVERYFGGFAPIMNADIGKIAKVCRDIDKEPVMWTCGSDRVKSYEKQCVQKYIDMYDLDPAIRVHEIKRTDDDISASKVRECILKNDYRGYCKLMPKWSHDKFELYKKYIVIKENNRFKKMKNLKDLINESIVCENKWSTDDCIKAFSEQDSKLCKIVIKKSLDELKKKYPDTELKIIYDLVESVVITCIDDCESWVEDIRDYREKDGKKCFEMFLSSFVISSNERLYDEYNNELTYNTINDNIDTFGAIICKYAFQVYNLK